MAEELIFRTVVQTDKSVKETDKLKDSLKKVSEEVQGAGDKNATALNTLNERMKSNNLTLGEAKRLVKEYGDLALRAGTETPIGQQAIQQAGQLKDRILDLRTEITNAGTDGANLKAALQFGGTIVAGFGAIKGSMALLGIENEDLQKTLVKLQAVTTVLMSIEQVRASLEKESLVVTKAKVIWTKAASAAQYIYTIAVGTTTGAMKALRIAMLAIPIVAIIAGIVALIAVLANFLSEEEKAEEQNNALNKSFEEQNKLLERNERIYKRQADNKRALMASEGATSEQLLEFDKNRLFEEEKGRQENLNSLKKNIIDKKQVYIQAAIEGNTDLQKTIKDEIFAQEDKYNKLKELDGQYLVDKKLLENKFNDEKKKKDEEGQKELENKQKEWARKEKEEREKRDQKQLEEKRLLEDLLIANIVDSDARKLAQLQLQQTREIEETTKKFGEKSETLKQLELKHASDMTLLKKDVEKQNDEDEKAKNKKLKDEQDKKNEQQRKDDKAFLEGKLIEMREDFELTQKLKLDLAKLEMDQTLAQTDLTEGEIFKIKQEYKQKVDNINQETADKEVERQKNLLKATEAILGMGLNAAQGLADAFFDYKISKAKKGSEEELKLEKRKFEINKKLQIAQAIVQGIQATLAAYSSGVAIPVVGTVAGPAFAAAAALTSALSIAKIKNTQFEGGGSETSTPSVSAPSVNITQPNQQQDNGTLTEGLPGSEGETVKVVMVDSDLKAALEDNSQVSVVSNIG